MCAGTAQATMVGCPNRTAALKTQYNDVGFYSTEPGEQNLHVKRKNQLRVGNCSCGDLWSHMADMVCSNLRNLYRHKHDKWQEIALCFGKEDLKAAPHSRHLNTSGCLESPTEAV